MPVNYIALAVPFFFLLIGAELLFARRRRKVYRFNDAVTDLSCGITSQIAVLFYAAIVLGVYARAYEQHRLFTLSGAPAWLLAFVGVDVLYYGWHRASHEVNVLWAAHVVHHQSEDYNLAVALRQSVLTGWTTLPFYLPLAFLGVPTVVFATTQAFSTLYQFWIHTELIGKTTGPVSWVFNLPSHHRVHHAINPRYLDKNYGATLIVWDRLFGTFEEEGEAPVYGITTPLRSFDPLWAQVHYWIELARLARAAPSAGDKLRVWWKGPAWSPAGLPKPPMREVTPATVRKFDPPLSPRRKLYVGLNFVAIVATTFAVMMWQARMPRAVVAVVAVLVVLGVWTAGALLEGRRWAPKVEAVRLALVALAVAWLLT
jgi:alkylglycerol monooxygenase